MREAMPGELKEKRASPRIKCSRAIRYQIRGTPEFNNVTSDNLSVMGVGFLNNKFIAPQTLLMLEINILSRILNPVGRVAWSAPLLHSDRYGLGVEFLELDPQQKRYLSDYINLQRGSF
jgi:hypothetical protein